jgi:hypothetical protein
MRRSSEPEERAQFTVAELLARYGESAPTAGRRHRRAAEDSYPAPDIAAEPTAQPIAERSWVDSLEPAVRPPEPLPSSDLPRRHGSPQVDWDHAWTPGDSTQGRSIRLDSAQSATSQRHTSPSDATRRDLVARDVTQSDLFQPLRNGRGGQEWAPAVGPPSSLAGETPLPPPVVASPPTPARAVLSENPVTDQLPRFTSADSASWSSRRLVSAYQAGDYRPPGYQGGGGPESAQPPAGLGTVTRAILEQDANAADGEPQPSGSPLWEWVVMVSQIGIGIVGGAALWLICEWLWQRLPVVALVVALAVITGLVWVVRRVRRAEDLQTTVIAVLVGLFVTVSPAALLLVGR